MRSEPARFIADADLRTRNTFGIPARTPWLVEVDAADALPAVLADARLRDADVLVLGGGSNLLFAGDAPGPVLAIGDARIAIDWLDDSRARVRAQGGVPWHALVMHTLDAGLAGLENLALIPGTAGAAPIQNIGAYGVEVGERIHAVEAYDRTTGRRLRLSAAECGFGYRESVFKHALSQAIVTAVEFDLARDMPLKLGYAGVDGALQAAGITAPTARDVADAVIAVRRSKLPDPAVLGNAGSFFKNPIVPAAQAQALRERHPSIPVYPLAPFPADAAAHGEAPHGGRAKLSAAWLIEACGFKGHRDGDAGVSAEHALVLVNHGQATGAQLLALAHRIADAVQARFGVAIEPEPRVIGGAW